MRNNYKKSITFGLMIDKKIYSIYYINMIKLQLIEDKGCAKLLQINYFGRELTGTNVALNCEGQIIGLLTYSILDAVHIKAVAIEESYRGRGLGDFLIRATLNNLTNTKMDIIIDYPDEHNYYYKFGFRLCRDMLICASDEVVFPSKCGH